MAAARLTVGSRPSGAVRLTIAERLVSGEITEAEAYEAARESALRTLDRVAKSRAELAQTLERKGFPDVVIGPLMDRFEVVGLLDDAAYAATIVRTRHSERRLARSAIAAELQRRGIDSEVAEAALAQIDEESEQGAAEAFAAVALARTVGQPRDARLRKVIAALGRRGYSTGLATRVALRALDAEGGDGSAVEAGFGFVQGA